MIPGGTVGAHIFEHSKMGLGGSFQVIDDGTYITCSFGGVALWRVVKSSRLFEVPNAFGDFGGF